MERYSPFPLQVKIYNRSSMSSAWPPASSVESTTIPCQDGSGFLSNNTEQRADHLLFLLFLRLALGLPSLSPRPSNVTPAPRISIWKHGCPDAEEGCRQKDINRNLEARLSSAMHHIETLGAEDSNRLQEENNRLTLEVNSLPSLVSELEQHKVRLSYDDLRPGGALALGAAVKAFTFFPDFDCTKTFLELLNFAEEGKLGLCENLVGYSVI